MLAVHPFYSTFLNGSLLLIRILVILLLVHAPLAGRCYGFLKLNIDGSKSSGGLIGARGVIKTARVSGVMAL